MLKLGFWCTSETTKHLRGELLGALGQDMGRKPERVAEEAEGLVRGEIEKLEIRKEGVHTGGLQLGRQPAVIEEQSPQGGRPFSVADVPGDVLEEVPIGFD